VIDWQFSSIVECAGRIAFGHKTVKSIAKPALSGCEMRFIIAMTIK